MTQRDEDARMLDEILAKAAELDEADEEHTIPSGAFEDMRQILGQDADGRRGWGLSDKQRAWIKSVYERLFDSPTYENLASSGRVTSEPSLTTPTPEVLRKPLPMKPPGRQR